MSRRRSFTLIELLVVVAILALLLAILLPSLGKARQQAKKVKCQSNLRTIGHAVQFYLGDHRDAFPFAMFYGCLGYRGRSLWHQPLGSQLPESTRPMNAYFNVTDNPVDDGPQVVRRHNDLFECPSDRGDAYEYFALTGKFFVEHGTSYTYASDSREIDPPPPAPPLVPTFGILSCRGLRLSDVKYTAKKIVFQEPVFNPLLDPQDPRAQWHFKGRPHGNLLFADGHVDFAFPQIFEPYDDPNENHPYY